MYFLPQGFPPRLAARVQAAEIKAGRKFPDLEEEVRERIVAKMDAFAKIALEIAESEEWSLDSVVPGLEAYLRHICTVDLTRFVPTGMLQDSIHGLIEEIRESDNWLSYMQKVERLSKRSHDAHERAASPSSSRKTLKDSYLLQFPDARILDICWAAAQHYSEWKRWMRNAVKDGSAPDRAFRSILTSGKLPSEHRKVRRPDGWK
jgi:hypothetical protein